MKTDKHVQLLVEALSEHDNTMLLSLALIEK